MIACFYDEHATSVLPFDDLRRHFKIDFFHESEPFFQALRQKSYSTILLNYNLELLKAVQTGLHYNGCSVIITAPEEFEDRKLQALSAGAHDFFTNKMNAQELIIKVKNKEKSFFQMNSTLKLGNVNMVFSELKTYLYGKPVDVTIIEMKMLRLLIKNYPAIVTKEELVNDVWPSQKILPTTINTHIYNLRSKFLKWEFEVITIKSQGYVLVSKQNDQHLF